MVVTILVVTMLVVIVILALMYMMILLDAAVKHALKLGVDRILINFVLPCCFVWRFLCVFKEVHAKKKHHSRLRTEPMLHEKSYRRIGKFSKHMRNTY